MLRAISSFVPALVLAWGMAPVAMASDFDDGAANVKVSSDIGEFLAADSLFSPALAGWPNETGQLKGKAVYVGRGCEADGIFFGPPDAYLADPAGKVALIDRGACRFTTKVARAEAAGAIGAIVVNVPGDPAFGAGDWRIPMGPDFVPPAVGIPAVFVGFGDGSALAAAAPVNVNLLYKPFTLLKDALDKLPTLLSGKEKDDLKKLISRAAEIIEGDNPNYGEAALLAFQFQNEVISRFFEGKIELPAAQSLVDSSGHLGFRLSSLP
ncbi:PA domain-containing protein [Lentisalinibacter salinarum]|uniref:PA domain-containing protein n=1 Tax=Lentisalinibacter salinarum TaxID=2992239 RepID=UPI0038709ADA